MRESKSLKALVAGGVARNKAEFVMGLVNQRERSEMIIESLIVDRLIVETNGVLQLPL